MSGQVHPGTVFRALFAGGIAVWSKAAAVAKVRLPRRRSQKRHPIARGPISAASLTFPLPLSTGRLEEASPEKPPLPREQAR